MPVSAFDDQAQVPKPEKTLSHLIGALEFSDIRYKDGIVDVAETAVSVKASYQIRLRPDSENWNLGFSTIFTAVPVSVTGTSESIRFFWLRASIGYGIVSGAWKLSIRGGGYYTTTLTSNNLYGYGNMFGPELYPELTRTFNGGSALSVYGKFSPAVDNAGLNFHNTELAAGLSYASARAGLVYSIDFSDLNLSQSGLQAQAKIISLGLGLPFF